MVWKDNLSVARKIPNCIYLFNNHWAGTVVIEVRLSLSGSEIYTTVFILAGVLLNPPKRLTLQHNESKWINPISWTKETAYQVVYYTLQYQSVEWDSLTWTLDSIQRIRSGCRPHLQHTTADCPCQMCLNYSVWFLQWQRRVESNIQAWGEEYEAATHRARRSHLREKAVFWICVQQQCEQVWICRTAFKPAYTKRSVPGLIPQTVTSMSLSKYKNWRWSSQEQTDEQFMMKVQDSQTR